MGPGGWRGKQQAGREAGLRAALDGRLGLRQGEVGRRATDWDQGLGQRREIEERRPPAPYTSRHRPHRRQPPRHAPASA